jgi:PAS domain S-box-containing protein
MGVNVQPIGMKTWLRHIQRVWHHRWFPFIVGMVATFAIGVVWQQLNAQQNAYVGDMVLHEVNTMERSITQELTERVQALQRMVSRWEVSGGTPLPLWQADAERQMGDLHSFQAIEWVDAAFQVQWVVPEAGNEAARKVGLNQEPARQRTLNIARDLDQPIFSHTLSLIQGGQGILLNIPIFIGQHFDGFIVGVFQFPNLFESFTWIADDFPVRVYDRETLIYQSQPSAFALASLPFQRSFFIHIYGLNWRVEVAPTVAFIDQRQSFLPNLILGGGLLGAWMLAFAIYLGQQSDRYTQQAREMNQHLQLEIGIREHSEARFRDLVNHLNAGIVIHSPDTHIVFCNATACDLLGLTEAQMLGKMAIDPTWHFVREDGQAMPLEDFPVNRVIRTQQAFRNYVLGIYQHHHLRSWVLVNGFPEWNDQQQLQQVVITFVDISGLKQAEAHLKKLNEVMENALSGISKLDTEGRYLYVNNAYATIIGYDTPEQLIGRSWQQTVHPDSIQKVQRAYGRMKQQGKVEVEAQGIRPDGSVFHTQLVMVATYDEQQFVGHYCFMKDISEKAQLEAERRRAKAAIERELMRTKALLNNSLDGIVVMNQTGDVVESSPSFADMLGYSLEETLELNVADWDAQWTAPELQEMMALPNPIPRFETRHRRRDGSLYEVEISWSQVAIEGEVLHFCVCRDISERKQAETERNRIEAELRQSEATKKAIIQAIPDLLIRMHADGSHLEFISNSPFNLVDPQQMGSDVTTHDVLPPALVQLRLEYTQRAVTTGQLQLYEHTVLVKGQVRYEEIRIAPLLQGEVLVMVRDITETKQAENDLRHQKEMFQTIFTHSPMMIALFDANSRVTMVNPAMEQVLGWSQADWQQQDLLSICFPEPTYRQMALDHMMAATGQWKDMTTLNARGEILETSWANVPLLDGMTLGIGQDISERKQKEVILQQAMEAAEAANIAKSLFLANMSHELRTPLNVILGFTQVLHRDPTLTADQRENLETIRRSGDHLLGLINDVLDLSKIEAGHFALEAVGFDLLALLHTLRTMLAERASAKGLALVLNIAPTVPQFIVGDAPKLRQVLINLVGNAIKFTETGGVTVTVTVLEPQVTVPEYREHQGSGGAAKTPIIRLQFRVADTGVGIAPVDFDTIFDAFAQARAGKAAMQGTGLGLTISARLVELMGGQLYLASDLGQGSTFAFTLAVQPVSSAHPPAAEQSQVVLGIAPSHRHRRILVVDDQADNRQLLVTLLQQVGLDVREASNGEEAVRLWQAWHPDLTWMDIRMPGVDGYEATRQIRAMETENPSIIIALTAQASQSDRTLALAAGCNDYLSKPFQAATLFRKMAEFLGLEYIYAQPESLFPVATTGQPPTKHDNPCALALPTLNATDMPPDWLRALEEAAICGDDQAILALTAQLPLHLTAWATCLNNLAQQFQFEQILQMLTADAAMEETDSPPVPPPEA